MRIIITGALGQLGRALQKRLEPIASTIIPADIPDFDVAQHTIVDTFSNFRPDLIIHAGAITDVDGCAKDPDMAFSVNAFGTQNVAHACLRANAEMVYISTNEVFDGRSERPYTENARTNPINPYGSSKRAGEQMAAHYLKDKLYIVRTAWLYSQGSNTFPAKIIAAAAANKELRVVTDEVSSPTYVPDLVEAVAQLIQTRAYGIYHFTNSGYCSRYDFAKQILRLSDQEDIPIHPITLAEYQRPSVVPPFAPLVNTKGAELGIELRPWQKALAEYFEAGV